MDRQVHFRLKIKFLDFFLLLYNYSFYNAHILFCSACSKLTPKKIKVMKSFLIRIARVRGNTLFFFQDWYFFYFFFSLCSPFFSSFDIVFSFFGFAFLLLFFYFFVFILIENYPLKNIARLYEARLYFVVDEEKRLLEKLVELLFYNFT